MKVIKSLLIVWLLGTAGCATATPVASCPVAERGAWTVVSPAEGHPGLETADICDEQLTDDANYRVCLERAAQFNREVETPVYFVMWSEE